MKVPHPPFFLFGMGNRRKLLYKGGSLFDVSTGELLRSWKAVHEQIIPHEYTVKWQTRDGRQYSIREDETGVCLMVEGTRTYLTVNPVHLPDFKGEEPGIFGNSQNHLLRVLLHEVLINVVEGKPMSSFLARPAPTYRDASIICEALRRTGNLDLARDWIEGLTDPFDLSRDGEREPDNLGQVLFLISLVSDKNHPLVARVLEAAEGFRCTDYICGRTDGAEHPVYQTKWLKFGLKSLGLPDAWHLPPSDDPYASVFWLDYRDIPAGGPPFPEMVKEASPQLAWAEAHFHAWDPPMEIPVRGYPLSWEVQSEREPPYGMSRVSPEFVERRVAAPQARHAAEMLLYFLDCAQRGAPHPEVQLQYTH
jgi:hypothetical protein